MKIRTALVIMILSFIYVSVGVVLQQESFIVIPALWALYGFICGCIAVFSVALSELRD